MDCFSGIGGFTIGLEAAGMQTIAFCEIEDFPRKVLAKHWPDVPIARDIRKLSYNRKTKKLIYDGEVIYVGSINVVCGGFPCQDLSVAGNQKGITAERSGLWSELCRIISEIRPKYAIVENVTALISGDSGRWFGRVLGDLAEIGYDCEWHCISASELGAHHHRDRVWIICYSQHAGRFAAEIGESHQAGNGSDQEGEKSASEFAGSSNTKILADTNSKGLQKRPILRRLARSKDERNQRENIAIYGRWNIEPDVGRVANGIPRRVDRLKGLGNAVVPQIPELIGRAIMEAER